MFIMASMKILWKGLFVWNHHIPTFYILILYDIQVTITREKTEIYPKTMRP